ncbi:DsrE family protein [Luteimonas mephitis]|uniref:DsrE family protein n=1 Tax=Luteimonas mephitis TaxID=83615 RepID=UPI00040A3350|nr:DsrE family protein [Luteimonas mephitis]
MKLIAKLLFSTLALLSPLAPAAAQEFTTPAIAGYGEMVVLEDAAVQPDPKLHYKLLFSVMSDKERQGVNNSIWSVARIINQLHAGGVPKENIDIVVVFHGPGIGPALDEETHQAKYGKPNPNLALMKTLTKNGVTFYACGQTMATNSWSAKNLNDQTTLASSALMVVANYQLKGYALMQM